MKASRYDETSDDYEFEFFDLTDADLIVEWNRQSGIMFRHTCMLADAEAKMEQADVNVDIVEAEMDEKIRKKFTRYGFEKPPTEAALKLAIKRSEEWKEAKRKWIEAKHTRDIYKGAVQALEHRKVGLGKRVDLHGQGYHADPKAKDPEATNRVRERANDDVMKAVSDRLNQDDDTKKTKRKKS